MGRAHTNNLKEDAKRKEFSEDVKTSQSTMCVISIVGRKMVHVTFSPRKHAVARNAMRRKSVALGSHTKQKSVKCDFHWLHSSTSAPFKKLVTGMNVFSVSSRTPLNVFSCSVLKPSQNVQTVDNLLVNKLLLDPVIISQNKTKFLFQDPKFN